MGVFSFLQAKSNVQEQAPVKKCPSCKVKLWDACAKSVLLYLLEESSAVCNDLISLVKNELGAMFQSFHTMLSAFSALQKSFDYFEIFVYPAVLCLA